MITKYALLSVYNKSGIVELANFLVDKYKILASGGTAKVLKNAGIKIIDVSEYTGQPELFGGRVKTLHPKIHGGILAHNYEELKEAGIDPIDLVVCNLYPFETIIKETDNVNTIIENIDIGGPTLIRAAAKNYSRVTVLSSPDDYQFFMDNYDKLDLSLREEFARKAFAIAARYDIAISNYFERKQEIPQNVFQHGKLIQNLRYGENPHQKSAVYSSGEMFYERLSEKDVSYNNILDVLAGLQLIREFSEPGCVIIKHRTPCGAATADNLTKAYLDALETDKMSAYGGVYCFNRIIDINTAKELVNMFVDTIIAPGYEEQALLMLKNKKKTLILKDNNVPLPKFDIHEIPNGLVLQERDIHRISSTDIKIVSEKKPDDNTIDELLFAWNIVKHSRSNAIAITRETMALGIGSGQTSRYDAAKQAIERAGDRVKGAVMASDAFFPFRDTIDLAAKHGIRAVISPAGSIRDQESIDAANEHNIILVFTNVRAFKH